MKITDFGLAKDCYEKDVYVKKSDTPLPIKWMSIESLRDNIFTTKSDVWSFGILLWELFTLAGNPYPGVQIDAEFYIKLRNGYRMLKPEYCCDEIYSIMLNCWNNEPEKRPDFNQLSDQFFKCLSVTNQDYYLKLEFTYQWFSLFK